MINEPPGGDEQAGSDANGTNPQEPSSIAGRLAASDSYGSSQHTSAAKHYVRTVYEWSRFTAWGGVIKPWIKSSSFWTALPTVAIAITTVIYTHYARKQWQTMSDQAALMQEQLREMQKQYPKLAESADAAKDSVGVARDSLASSNASSANTLTEMEKQSEAVKEAADAAQINAKAAQQELVTIEDQASARLRFENLRWTRSSEKTIVTFDVVNEGGSEATEIGEEGIDVPVGRGPYEDEALMAAGNLDPAAEPLPKGGHRSVQISYIQDVHPIYRQWYAYRKYTYRDIFQRTNEVCTLVLKNKGVFYFSPCPQRKTMQKKPN